MYNIVTCSYLCSMIYREVVKRVNPVTIITRGIFSSFLVLFYLYCMYTRQQILAEPSVVIISQCMSIKAAACCMP